jgi:hypothetical protein
MKAIPLNQAMEEAERVLNMQDEPGEDGITRCNPPHQ